jgi:hypothetical protein
MHMTKNLLTAALIAWLSVALSVEARAAGSGEQSGPPSSSTETTVTIYPLLVRAPIMGAEINLPSIPIDGGGEFSGTTDLSLNSAWMTGLSVESGRWFAEAFGLYAALTADRTTPRLEVDTKTYLLNGRAGVRLFDGFSATGGFRLFNVDLDATVTLPILGTTAQGQAERTLWDPLIGVDWRRQVSDRLGFEANLQGGGFGVGTDAEVSAEAYVKWRIARHLLLRTGYTFFYYKMTVADVSIGTFQRTLISKQTLHGPEIAIGIPF